MLNEYETELETLADADWLIDSDSDFEIDLLVETEVLMNSETELEILTDVD